MDVLLEGVEGAILGIFHQEYGPCDAAVVVVFLEIQTKKTNDVVVTSQLRMQQNPQLLEGRVVIFLTKGILGWAAGGILARGKVGRLQAIDLVVESTPIRGSEVVLACVEGAGIGCEVVAGAKDGAFGGEGDVMEGLDIGDEIIGALFVGLSVKEEQIQDLDE